MQRVFAALVVVGILATLPESSVQAGHTFVRGDANGDGELGITDVIVSLSYLFLSGPVPDCLEACEWNGDGAVELSDAVGELSWIFVFGTPSVPPAASTSIYPLVDCGPIPAGGFGCLVSPCP